MQDYRRNPAYDYVLPAQDTDNVIKKPIALKKILPEKKATNTEKPRASGSFYKSLKNKNIEYGYKTKRCDGLQDNQQDIHKEPQNFKGNQQDELIKLLRLELNVSQKTCSDLKQQLSKLNIEYIKLYEETEHLRENVVPAARVNILLYKAIRTGYGLDILLYHGNRFFRKAPLRHGFHMLALYTLGESRSCQLLKKCPPSVSTCDQHLSKTLSKDTLTLLRTEQLFLMKENADLLNQVNLFKKAIQHQPQKARKHLNILLEAATSYPCWNQLENFPSFLQETHHSTQKNHNIELLRLIILRFDFVLKGLINYKLEGALHQMISSNLDSKRFVLKQGIVCTLQNLCYSLMIPLRRQLALSFHNLWKTIILTTPFLSEDFTECLPLNHQLFGSIKHSFLDPPLVSHNCRSVQLTKLTMKPISAKQRKLNSWKHHAFVMTPEYYSRFPSIIEWKARHYHKKREDAFFH